MPTKLLLPRSKRVVIIIVGLLILAVVCNLSYRYENVKRRGHYQRFSFETLAATHAEPELYLAGFPRTFYVNAHLPDTPLAGNFSLLALAEDLALWLLLIMGVYCYERYVSRTSSTVGRRIGMLDLLLAVSVVAGLLAYWRSLDAKYTALQATVRKISSEGGEAVTGVFLPGVVPAWFPEFIIKRFSQLYNVRLENPSVELVSLVLDQPMLQQLRIGGVLNERITERIGKLPLLWDLRISGMKLTAADVLNLRPGADRLIALNLMRTNITWDGIQALGEMPRLQQLCLVHTNCKLSDLNSPPWASSIETMLLPHPGPGTSDSLELEGWSSLREIVVAEYDEVKNASLVSIDLRNMPALKKIGLDPLQKFDLTLRDTPVLEELAVFDSQVVERARNQHDVPGSLWFSRFEIRNAAELEELSVHGQDLESFYLSEVPKLSFGIGTYFHKQPSYVGAGPVFVGDQLYSGIEFVADIPVGRRQSWIDNLAKCDGPMHVDLAGIPLNDCDFSGLSENKRLKTLILSASLTGAEAMSLQGAELEELDLTENALPDGLVGKLAKSLPNLSAIYCSAEILRSVKLVNLPHLEKIFAKGDSWGLKNMNVLELQGLPEFEEPIIATRPLTKCILRDLPKLSRLHLFYPLPDGSELSGFRDLRMFAVGGSIVDDELFDSLLQCSELEWLELSYASVTEQKLCEIANLKNLKSLRLYHCNVTDAVVREIGKLTQLQRLQIDYTRVTPKALGDVVKLKKIENLSFCGTEMSKGSLAPLAGLPSLNRIGIGGAKLDKSLGKLLAQVENLYRLDLSGGTLTEAGLLELAKGGTDGLEEFVLRDIDQPDFDLASLLELNGRFDVTNSKFLANSDLDLVNTRLFDSQRLPFQMDPFPEPIPYDVATRDSLVFQPEIFAPNYRFPESVRKFGNRPANLRRHARYPVVIESSRNSFNGARLNNSGYGAEPLVESPTGVRDQLESLFYWLGYYIATRNSWFNNNETTLESSYEEF